MLYLLLLGLHLLSSILAGAPYFSWGGKVPCVLERCWLLRRLPCRLWRTHRHNSIRDAIFSAAHFGDPEGVAIPRALALLTFSSQIGKEVVHPRVISTLQRHLHAASCRAVGVSFVPLLVESLGGWSGHAAKTLFSIGRLQGQRLGIHPSPLPTVPLEQLSLYYFLLSSVIFCCLDRLLFGFCKNDKRRTVNAHVDKWKYTWNIFAHGYINV